MRLSIPSVVALVAIASAGAFAAGRSLSPATVPLESVAPTPPTAGLPKAIPETDEPLPPGHPPTSGAGAALPAGHPHVDPMDPSGAQEATGDPPAAAPSSLEWKAPARWQAVPNASPMRLATYRVPRAAGDSEDAELTITQAGGSVEANAVRWIGQFDAAGQKTAKRSARKVGALEIAIVEAQGTSSGGMGADAGAGSGKALLGAIVSTPGMPHFFKLTGPVRSVLAARTEFDAMMASLAQH